MISAFGVEHVLAKNDYGRDAMSRVGPGKIRASELHGSKTFQRTPTINEEFHRAYVPIRMKAEKGQLKPADLGLTPQNGKKALKFLGEAAVKGLAYHSRSIIKRDATAGMTPVEIVRGVPAQDRKAIRASQQRRVKATSAAFLGGSAVTVPAALKASYHDSRRQQILHEVIRGDAKVARAGGNPFSHPGHQYGMAQAAKQAARASRAWRTSAAGAAVGTAGVVGTLAVGANGKRRYRRAYNEAHRGQ